jgi:hypothetical protein
MCASGANNTNASRYVAVHLQLGPLQFLLTWRLYLKHKQVKALNRQRRAQGLPLLTYHALPSLVQQMLDEIAPQLPAKCKVYVLFDAWYASSELLRFIRAHGWHFICAAKANRRLDTYSLAEWWHHLGHQPTERVTLRSTKGSRTYSTRYRVGRLRRYPELLTAVFCKRNRRDTRPVYFLCSDITLSVRCILKYYRLPLASRSGQLLSQSALGPGRLSRAVLRRHRALACPGVRCLRLPAIPAGAAVVRRPQGDSAAAGRRLGRPSTLAWSPDDPGILPVWCGRA